MEETTPESDAAYIEGNGKLVVGITIYEPMNYYDDAGNLTGFDTEFAQAVCDKLAEKICNLRVFEDENGKMNLDLAQVGGSILVVSQFTLYADVSKRRPGFTKAAKPDLAIPLYERFMEQCRQRGFTVEHGEFGADMKVASVNDGPVTILYDTDEH